MSAREPRPAKYGGSRRIPEQSRKVKTGSFISCAHRVRPVGETPDAGPLSRRRRRRGAGCERDGDPRPGDVLPLILSLIVELIPGDLRDAGEPLAQQGMVAFVNRPPR